MPVSTNSDFRKNYVPLKTRYKALEYADPEFLNHLSHRSRNTRSNVMLKQNQKPTCYTDDIEKYELSWDLERSRGFGASVIACESGNGFLIRNKNRTPEELNRILKNAVNSAREIVFQSDKVDDRLWQERPRIDRVTIDIFGNFKQDESVRHKYHKNNIDPSAHPTLQMNVKPDFEIDPSAKKYRELIAKQLINPEHKVHALSTEHYGVYEAHDHTKKHPHLLIIPYQKKYENFLDLAEHGSDKEIQDYLKVLEKVANEGPRLPKLEHELFFTDTEKLQKIPFFYTEYIPRRNEGLPEEFDSHNLLKNISIGQIQQNNMQFFTNYDNQKMWNRIDNIVHSKHNQGKIKEVSSENNKHRANI